MEGKVKRLIKRDRQIRIAEETIERLKREINREGWLWERQKD